MKQKQIEIKGTIRGRLSDGTPNPVDIHVGQQLKKARKLRGLSQEQLASEMGLTFQQVQKYEKGLNRIGASRLWDLAQILNISIDFFYQDMDRNIQNQSPRNISNLQDSGVQVSSDELIFNANDLSLLRYYKRIKNPVVAKSIIHLVRSLVEDTDEFFENSNFLDVNIPSDAEDE